MAKPFIVDGHLDLAMAAVEYNRDVTLPVADIRRTEPPDGHPDAGTCTVSLPAMAAGGVGLCTATLFARAARPSAGLSGWASPALAKAAVEGQLAYYRTLASQGYVRIVASARDLQLYAAAAAARGPGAAGAVSGNGTPLPPGILLLMECADPLLEPADVEAWVRAGVRAIGLAHYGENRYAHGTGSEGGLNPGGRDVLRHMEAGSIVLDVSHLADAAFWEALDHFGGPVMASHSNCRAFAPGNRQLDDAQIDALAGRGGVIGIVMETEMLAGERGKLGGREAVGWDDVVYHIDHVCQRAGDHRHVGLGSDLDGGFGRERAPDGIDTIADLTRLADHLDARGYAADQVADILGGNWLRFWRGVLKAASGAGAD